MPVSSGIMRPSQGPQSRRGLRASGRGRAKAAPKRRPSAAKRIIWAEVPKDTGPNPKTYRYMLYKHSIYGYAVCGNAMVRMGVIGVYTYHHQVIVR
jgi:hypothetical protein